MTLALVTLLLTGCAARQKPIAATVVIKRECMESVDLSDKSECRGPSGDSLHCTGFVLNKKVGCGPVLEVNKEKKQ